jgi:hypothetical protein
MEWAEIIPINQNRNAEATWNMKLISAILSYQYFDSIAFYLSLEFGSAHLSSRPAINPEWEH